MEVLEAPYISPIILPYDKLSSAIIQQLKDEYLTERPEIPHLSELIYCLTRSYDNRMSPEPPTDEEVMLFCLGFGLERVLLGDFAKMPMKCKDGIYYSIDFISLGDVRAELKTTRTSMKKHEEEGLQQSWLQQMAGYCYAEGHTEFDLATLYILGDYRPPFPKIIGRKLQFSELQLTLNWTYMLNRRDIFMQHYNAGVRPEPYIYNMSWECQYCKYKLRCELAKATGG